MDGTAKVNDYQPASVSSTLGNRSAQIYSHIRSCLVCRSRKIKCDRQKPCSNCVRQGVDCTYPPGPGRAPKNSCKKPNPRILDRLSRIETLVRQLERQGNVENVDLTSAAPAPGLNLSEYEKSTQTRHRVCDAEALNEQQLGRLLIEDSRSCYVSNIFWANLGDQIEELRDLLYEPAPEDEEVFYDESSLSDQPAMLGSDAAIMAFRSLACSLHAYHPSVPQSVALLGIFQEKVLPVVRIFHMPTLIQIFWDAVASLDQPDKDIEALLFAIYYSAVISMEPEQCLEILGIPRPHALQNLLFATQQALARANLLGTQSMTVLQAAVLFLSALRNEDDSRTVWSLTSLVYHIARTMGLHRDGASFGLKPLETELRRRLWWHVCLLDIRSSEYDGCEPIVQENGFDTRFPLNINDSDVTAEMTEAPKEREEATEMTFCLIRCESISVVWKISYIPTGSSVPGQKSEMSYQERLALVEDLRHRLDERYVQHCDTSQPFFLAAATVARLITARTWLVVHYPLARQPNQVALPVEELWQRIFQTSIEILELSLRLSTNNDIAKWAWHSRAHIQWHAVALVLSMICSQTPSPDCDRAWKYVTVVYDRSNIKENEKRGALWRPIKRLMAKARYVREMQAMGCPEFARRWKGGKDAPMTPKALLQANDSIVSQSEDSFDVTSQSLNNGNEAGMEDSKAIPRIQSMDWSTQSQMAPMGHQDLTMLGGPSTMPLDNLFPQGLQYATTGWGITLQDLDMDLMELGYI